MKDNVSKTCQVPNGVIVVIGGHENKGEEPEKKGQKSDDYNRLEILKTFIKLTNKEHPVVEVITTASSEGRDSFENYLSAFSEIGVSHTGHIHHGNRAEVLYNDMLERIDKADAIFFSGGDQLKLTSIYGGTQFLLRLKQRYWSERLVLAGTSAGAMAFSTTMIFAGNKHVQQMVGEVRTMTGFQFLTDVCIDTHFVERGRFVRMAQVIATNPTCIGLGIEEDTAMIVRNGIEAEVIGSGIVIVLEGFSIKGSNILNHGSRERIAIEDINVKLLAKGCRYIIPQNNPNHV